MTFQSWIKPKHYSTVLAMGLKYRQRGTHQHYHAPKKRDAWEEGSWTKFANDDCAGELKEHVGGEEDQKDNRLWVRMLVLILESLS